MAEISIVHRASAGHLWGMKGLIFSELVNWAEQAFSPQVADDMISRAQVPNDGAYTSGGYYPHGEALALLTALAAITGQAVPALARSYGQYLSARLAALHPHFMAGHSDVGVFLTGVETHIHAEVRKLYPEARTPRVETEADADGMLITYASHRPFADVAHGLIEGFIAYFGQDLLVERVSTSPDGHEATFRLHPKAG